MIIELSDQHDSTSKINKGESGADQSNDTSK